MDFMANETTLSIGIITYLTGKGAVIFPVKPYSLLSLAV